MKTITVKEQYKLFLETLNSCGCFLLQCPKEDVDYYIFEEFDTNRISFLHENTLSSLQKAGLITIEMKEKSLKLASMFAEMENTPLWNAESVLSEKAWRDILVLADEIKSLVQKEIP